MRFSRGVFAKEKKSSAGQRRREPKQPAVVPRNNVPVRPKLSAAPSLQSDPEPRSSFHGFWYWACETYGYPWKQAGKAYNGSAKYVKHQKHDQNASFRLSPSPHKLSENRLSTRAVPGSMRKSLTPNGFYGKAPAISYSCSAGAECFLLYV